MIKVGIVSDLHSEFWQSDDAERIGGRIMQNLADADLILLPGDIGLGADGIDIARALFADKPVFMVAGNHEFYHGDYDNVLEQLHSTATGNIQFLHNAVGIIGIKDTPIRIIGTTLWTDFDLHGTVDLSLIDATQLNDFRLVRYQGRVLRPADTLTWHREQRAWLLERLDETFSGITILMTHHAPVSFAIGTKYVGDSLSPCFASRLETMLLRDDLPLVVWGHTHYCVDRMIDTTRFVSNQTGYPGHAMGRLGTETQQYGQIVELASG